MDCKHLLSLTNGPWDLIWMGLAGEHNPWHVPRTKSSFPYLKGHFFGGRLSSVSGEEGKSAWSSQADQVKSTGFNGVGDWQLAPSASLSWGVRGEEGGYCRYWGWGPASLSQTKSSTVLQGNKSLSVLFYVQKEWLFEVWIQKPTGQAKWRLKKMKTLFILCLKVEGSITVFSFKVFCFVLNGIAFLFLVVQKISY